MAGTEGPVVFCLHGGGYSGYVIAFILNVKVGALIDLIHF